MSLFCALGFHNWSPWKVTKRGEVTALSQYRPGQKRLIGETLVQSRTCTSCNFTETKTQHIDLLHGD